MAAERSISFSCTGGTEEMKIISLVLKHFGDISLQKKLTVSYFLLIFFPLAVVGLFAYNISAFSIRNEVTRYISEVLQQVNDNIDNSIYELDRMAAILSVDDGVLRILDKPRERPQQDIYRDDAIIEQKINDLLNFRTNIEGLFLFSYNGEVYQYKGVNRSIRPDYTFTSTRWYVTMQSMGVNQLLIPTHIQDQVLTSGQRKTVFSYVREIKDMNTDKSLGNVLIDVNTDVIKKIWDKLNTKKSMELMIMDYNKTIIYHTREDMISTQFRSNYISKILKARNGSITAVIDNKPALVTFNTSQFTNWTVISIIPVSVLYSDITNISYVILLTVVLCLLLSFLIAVLISRSITKPIFKLRQLMKVAESGQFSINAPVRSKDEIGALSSSFNTMVAKINGLIQTVYETRILKKEAELNALQAQINPHFLYNTLQTIDIIAQKEGINVICMVCRSLSRMFRYSINRGKEFVPLSAELEHVKDYVNIQKVRFRDRFEVVYDIEEELMQCRVVKLILQPIVENALLHGIESKKGKCVITLSAKVLEEVAYISIEDTGVGMDEKQLGAIRESLNEEIIHAELDGLVRKSIGMKNVNARLRLYFGEQYGIAIESALGKGTKITISIPVFVHK